MPPSEFEHKQLLKLAGRQKDNHLYWVMLGWTAPTPQAALSFFKKAWKLKPGDAVILDGIQWAVEEILKKAVNLEPGEVTGFLQGLDAGLVFKPEDALAQTMPLTVEEMITRALPMPVQEFIEETRSMEAEEEESRGGWIIAIAYLTGTHSRCAVFQTTYATDVIFAVSRAAYPPDESLRALGTLQTDILVHDYWCPLISCFLYHTATNWI